MNNIRAFVAESNRIEGITRPPTRAELAAHEGLMALPAVTVADLERFVAVYHLAPCCGIVTG